MRLQSLLCLAFGFTLALAPVASAVTLTGNTGPGGFLDLGTTTDLTLWLRGDAGITQDGANRVSQWDDQSGNNNHMLQGTLNQQPLQTGQINGVPVVSFDGGANTPDSDQMISTNNASVTTFFIANRPTSFNNCCNPIVGNQTSFISIRYNGTDWQSPGDGNDFTNPAGSQFRVDGVVGTAAPQGTPHVLNAVRSGAPFNFTNLKLAQHNGFADRAYGGDIGEVTAFNRALNPVETSIVDNYLSAKFDIPLAVGAVDRYAGDTPGNGNRDLGVFGIGNDGSSVVPSAGSGGFGIDATGSLGAGDWVFAGQDGSAISIVPIDPLNSRWSKTWYVDVTGLLDGNATLAFDWNDAGLGSINDDFDRLFFSSDGVNFSTIDATSSINGDAILFDVAAVDLVDGFYTLGQAIPEPSSFLLLSGGVMLLARRRRRS